MCNQRRIPKNIVALSQFTIHRSLPWKTNCIKVLQSGFFLSTLFKDKHEHTTNIDNFQRDEGI